MQPGILEKLSVTPMNPSIVREGVLALPGSLTFLLTALVRDELNERIIGVVKYPGDLQLIEDPFSLEPQGSITRRMVGEQELAQIRAGRMTLAAQISTDPDERYVSSIDATEIVERMLPDLTIDPDDFQRLLYTQKLKGLLVTLRM